MHAAQLRAAVSPTLLQLDRSAQAQCPPLSLPASTDLHQTSPRGAVGAGTCKECDRGYIRQGTKCVREPKVRPAVGHSPP